MTTATERNNVIPQGRYLTATRHGDLVFTSGMTPRARGVLRLEGRIRADVPIANYRDAVELACSNALHAARSITAADERIDHILSLSVFIAAEEDFKAHAGLADFASELLREELGEAGIGARAAIGVATLPGNAPVEIQLVATICSEKNQLP
jgi:enamine deaminase RidA (YjgF/YER057c/UK114 family)